jgi:hypothetical protein
MRKHRKVDTGQSTRSRVNHHLAAYLEKILGQLFLAALDSGVDLGPRDGGAVCPHAFLRQSDDCIGGPAPAPENIDDDIRIEQDSV